MRSCACACTPRLSARDGRPNGRWAFPRHSPRLKTQNYLSGDRGGRPETTGRIDEREREGTRSWMRVRKKETTREGAARGWQRWREQRDDGSPGPARTPAELRGMERRVSLVHVLERIYKNGNPIVCRMQSFAVASTRDRVKKTRPR